MLTIFAKVPFAAAAQEAIFPEPLKASPIAVFELAQINEPPAGLLPKFPILIVEPGQTAIFDIGLTTGVG